MVPIHETDLAEERWAKAEWEHYELWERIEQRLRRRKWMVVWVFIVIFLAISAVPVWSDRTPKWQTRAAARSLAELMNELKRKAAVEHQAFRVKILDFAQSSYQVNRISACSSTESGEVLNTGTLVSSDSPIRLLSPEEATQLGLKQVLGAWCYDPVHGSSANAVEEAGFVWIPKADVSASRLDRVSTLLVSGILGEISFD